MDRPGQRPSTAERSLAIVVPTLDEERTLALALPVAMRTADEVVVSDGGSSDGTVELARSLGASVVEGSPGRGPQLNRGAAATEADIFLFLHADTLLPPGTAPAVRRAVASGAAWGGFLVRFDVDTPLYRLGSRLVNLRTRLTRLPLGDQAQFVSRRSFDEVGGFRDWPILEDLDLARRLRGRDRIAILPLEVTTSSRRYAERGIVRTIGTNWLIWALFAAGVSPHRLAALYRTCR